MFKRKRKPVTPERAAAIRALIMLGKMDALWIEQWGVVTKRSTSIATHPAYIRGLAMPIKKG